MTLPKSYYLPPYRAYIAGSIFMLMGIALTVAFVEPQHSIGHNLQIMFLSFDSVGGFIGSLLTLAIKGGMIYGGYCFIRSSNRIERARLDDNGFYYRLIPKGTNLQRTLLDIAPLSFTPYNQIKDISYRKSFWLGGQILLTDKEGTRALPALGVLNDNEKREIVEAVLLRIAMSDFNKKQ